MSPKIIIKIIFCTLFTKGGMKVFLKQKIVYYQTMKSKLLSTDKPKADLYDKSAQQVMNVCSESNTF